MNIVVQKSESLLGVGRCFSTGGYLIIDHPSNLESSMRMLLNVGDGLVWCVPRYHDRL